MLSSCSSKMNRKEIVAMASGHRNMYEGIATDVCVLVVIQPRSMMDELPQLHVVKVVTIYTSLHALHTMTLHAFLCSASPKKHLNMHLRVLAYNKIVDTCSGLGTAQDIYILGYNILCGSFLLHPRVCMSIYAGTCTCIPCIVLLCSETSETSE